MVIPVILPPDTVAVAVAASSPESGSSIVIVGGVELSKPELSVLVPEMGEPPSSVRPVTEPPPIAAFKRATPAANADGTKGLMVTPSLSVDVSKVRMFPLTLATAPSYKGSPEIPMLATL